MFVNKYLLTLYVSSIYNFHAKIKYEVVAFSKFIRNCTIKQITKHAQCILTILTFIMNV